MKMQLRRFLRPALIVLALVVVVAVQQPAYAPPTGITVQDEGVTKGTGVTTLNFVGPNFSAAVAGSVGTVTHLDTPGGGAGQDHPDWIDLRDKGAQQGTCDAGKAAANDAAWTSALADLAVPLPSGETGGVIYLPRGDWCFGHTVEVRDKVRVVGDGRRASRINALAGFNDTITVVSTGSPANVLVVLGNSNADQFQFAFGSRVEHVGIDASNVSGLIPLFSQQANERSGFEDVLVGGFSDTGVWMAPGSSNVNLDSAEVYGNASSGSSGLLRLESWEKSRVNDITAVAGAPVAAGSSGLRFHGFQSTSWLGTALHCEGVEVCARVQPEATTSADARVSLDTMSGHSTVSKVVQYDGPGGTSYGTHGSVRNIVALGSANTLVDNNPGGKTFTGTVTIYKVIKNRTVVTGSRAAMDPALVQTITVLATAGEINDQTTP